MNHIVKAINDLSIPCKFLIDPWCWKKICSVHNRRRNDVDKWPGICQQRGTCGPPPGRYIIRNIEERVIAAAVTLLYNRREYEAALIVLDCDTAEFIFQSENRIKVYGSGALKKSLRKTPSNWAYRKTKRLGSPDEGWVVGSTQYQVEIALIETVVKDIGWKYTDHLFIMAHINPIPQKWTKENWRNKMRKFLQDRI